MRVQAGFSKDSSRNECETVQELRRCIRLTAENLVW